MSHSPTVLILAAGENSRFFPFNTDEHKASLTLHGEPIIVRTLKDLEAHGFTDVVIVVSEKDFGGNGLSSSLQEYNLNLKLSFVLQPKAVGMGDALLRASDHLGEMFGVVFPSSIDAGTVLAQLVQHAGHDGAIAVTETSQPWMYGIVTVENERITHIIEKPAKGTEPSNLKVQGMYLLSRSYLEVLKTVEAQEYSFEVALEHFFKDHDVKHFKQDQYVSSLKYPWHLFKFQSNLFHQMRSWTAPDVQIAPTAVIDDSRGPVVIESGAKVGHAAKISGPCYIGRHAFVGDFSLVRESSIEEDVIVGSFTEVVRSIIFSRSEIHNGYLADSIIGSEVKIGAGLITANKRHDRENVQVSVKGQKTDMGRNNMGVCIGNRTKVGVRTTTMPGLMIGADAVIFPSQTLYENVEHESVIKRILPKE